VIGQIAPWALGNRPQNGLAKRNSKHWRNNPSPLRREISKQFNLSDLAVQVATGHLQHPRQAKSELLQRGFARQYQMPQASGLLNVLSRTRDVFRRLEVNASAVTRGEFLQYRQLEFAF